MAEQQGKVYLVGAGPGNIAYLTLQAQWLLNRADVVVYDALVDEQVLDLTPPHCLRREVGKRGGQPSTPQTDINQLLVEYCHQGHQVVRLKSGDPFIFGRSTAEIEALKQANCAFEVVPGLSSVLAAPLLAAIPLTDPVLSRSFAVVSAHEPDALNWEALSRLETLVILMGGKQLPELVHQLEKHGRSLTTPIAIIRWAGQPQQQVWEGTLASIQQQTDRQSLSPCVMVVGEVVRLRPYLQTAVESPMLSSISSAPGVAAKPLTGKTILVTRSAGQSSTFTTLLEEQGATVLELPTLVITPPSSWQALDQAIARLSEFDWLLLTSTNGVDYFFERLMALGKDARDLAGIKLAVVGKKTAQSLQQRGLQPDFIPPDFIADALVEAFPERDRLSELNLLFPRVETGGRDVLVKEFTMQGAKLTEVPAYESGCATTIPPEVVTALKSGKIDVVTFASSKTVTCFAQLLQTIDEPTLKPQALFESVCIASIGSQTSATCQCLFGHLDVEAEEYTLEGLTQAIVRWARDRRVG